MWVKSHVHNCQAKPCIMAVLHCLSFPGSFHNLVNVFGFAYNRLLHIYHTAIEFMYLKYKKSVSLETLVSCICGSDAQIWQPIS